jgi:hypothetical protein
VSGCSSGVAEGVDDAVFLFLAALVTSELAVSGCSSGVMFSIFPRSHPPKDLTAVKRLIATDEFDFCGLIGTVSLSDIFLTNAPKIL